MYIKSTIRYVALLLVFLLTTTAAHSQDQPLAGFGSVTEISTSRGIMEVDGVKMKFDGSTKVLNLDNSVDTYTKIIEVFRGTPIEWKARKGPKYPILLWVKPDLS